MELNLRTLTRILAPAALVAILLPAVPAQAATVSLEGVVTSGPEPDCVLVKDAQGNSFVLEGTGWYGIVGNDYVRLQGTIVPENRCGVTSGIQVADVSTIWRDQTHKVVVYERTTGGHFADWVRAHREHEWQEWERAHHIPPPPPTR